MAANSSAARYTEYLHQAEHDIAPRSRCASSIINQRCRASAITMIFSLLLRIWLSSWYSIPAALFHRDRRNQNVRR